MKQRKQLAILLTLALLIPALAGCKAENPAPTETAEPQPTQAATEAVSTPEITEAPPEPDPLEEALAQYRTIVSQAAAYDYEAAGEPTGVYLYALVQLKVEGKIPALLLEQETDFGISSVRVFQYDSGSKTVITVANTLMEGVAGVGGYRGSLSVAGDGKGLLSTEFSSGSGDSSTTRVTLVRDQLQYETLWEGNLMDGDDPTGDTIGFVAIDWHDISDGSALGGGQITPSTPAPEQGNGPSAPLTDGDRIVFSGTLGAYSHKEAVALQDMPDPEPEYDFGETYWIIVLDTPQNMTLRSGGGEGSHAGEVVMIEVSGSGIEQYAGQHLTFSIDGGNTYWPSDVSIPFGQPRTSDVHVLG